MIFAISSISSSLKKSIDFSISKLAACLYDDTVFSLCPSDLVFRKCASGCTQTCRLSTFLQTVALVNVLVHVIFHYFTLESLWSNS